MSKKKIENKSDAKEQKIDNELKTYNLKTHYDILGKVLAAPNKQKILYTLSVPKTPKEISKDTNLNFPTTSKTIKELEDLKLIEVNNKHLKKGKIITISKIGKDAIIDLNVKRS